MFVVVNLIVPRSQLPAQVSLPYNIQHTILFRMQLGLGHCRNSEAFGLWASHTTVWKPTAA